MKQASEAGACGRSSGSADMDPGCRFLCRKALRIVAKDRQLASVIWHRLQPHVPATVEHLGTIWEATGLNDLFRVVKYEPSDYFAKHLDGSFPLGSEIQSIFTINIFLNHGFIGGATRFYSAEDVDIGPGSVLGRDSQQNTLFQRLHRQRSGSRTCSRQTISMSCCAGSRKPLGRQRSDVLWKRRDSWACLVVAVATNPRSLSRRHSSSSKDCNARVVHGE